MHLCCRSVAVLILFCAALPAQRRVDSKNMYERVLAVVPMVGAGTWEDPKRPMFAPEPGRQQAGDRAGVIAWQFQPSDDGKAALVEFVFANRAAAAQVLSSLKANSSVKAFEKGKDRREDIEKAFKARKKDFDFERFAVRVP